MKPAMGCVRKTEATLVGWPASFASVPSISDLASLDTASDTQWLTIGKNARSGGWDNYEKFENYFGGYFQCWFGAKSYVAHGAVGNVKL